MSIPSNPITGGFAPAEIPVPGGPAGILEKVRQITRDLFPGPIEIETDSDPEDPASSWWTFCVESSLEHAELRPLRAKWHEAVYQLGVRDATQFRLAIVPL